MYTKVLHKVLAPSLYETDQEGYVISLERVNNSEWERCCESIYELVQDLEPYVSGVVIYTLEGQMYIKTDTFVVQIVNNEDMRYSPYIKKSITRIQFENTLRGYISELQQYCKILNQLTDY